jgi:hypothetical protein
MGKLNYLPVCRKCGTIAGMDLKTFASMGGKACAKGMTKAQRTERARRAALAMWAKKRAAAAKAKRAARKPRKKAA